MQVPGGVLSEFSVGHVGPLNSKCMVLLPNEKNKPEKLFLGDSKGILVGLENSGPTHFSVCVFVYATMFPPVTLYVFVCLSRKLSHLEA
jgi:hypothetical protein